MTAAMITRNSNHKKPNTGRALYTHTRTHAHAHAHAHPHTLTLHYTHTHTCTHTALHTHTHTHTCAHVWHSVCVTVQVWTSRSATCPCHQQTCTACGTPLCAAHLSHCPSSTAVLTWVGGSWMFGGSELLFFCHFFSSFSVANVFSMIWSGVWSS